MRSDRALQSVVDKIKASLAVSRPSFVLSSCKSTLPSKTVASCQQDSCAQETEAAAREAALADEEEEGMLSPGNPAASQVIPQPKLSQPRNGGKEPNSGRSERMAGKGG